MISKGIHHITAISGDPQLNLDFYSGLLKLKFIKKTINFDDPGTYHFYYGDDSGTPGTILTFFPWGRRAMKGKSGAGQVIAYAFAIPEGSLKHWENRLSKFKVVYNGPYERMGEKVISFSDPDGIEVEFIEDKRIKSDSPEIAGFHSASLCIESILKTEHVIKTIFGFYVEANEGNRYRFTSGENVPGDKIDLIVSPDLFRGSTGAGAVHHIAFRASDEKVQWEMRDNALSELLNPTEVIDRKYFRSVYFREPNGILFEIATDTPGFMVDEKKETLGQKLQLPEWLERKRDLVEKSLQKLTAPSPERIFLSE